MIDINYWNAKIYKNDDGSFVGGGLHAEEFFNEFGVKSYPMFKDQCYSHIPGKWAEDVRALIKQVQSELGDQITFTQIKEKWCWLTIYYSSANEAAGQRMSELINECINRMIKKEIHPPREQ